MYNLKFYKMSIKEIFKLVLIHLCTMILAFLIFTIFFPTLFLLHLPVHLYRFIISKLSKVFRPDLIKILEPHSATYAATKSETNVVLYIKLKGQPELEEHLNDWKWSFFKNVVLAKNIETGELLYPEFQQYIFIWFGFPFWKIDEQFSVYNHIYIKHYVSDSDLSIIETELLRTPFKSKQSPWELVICTVPHYTTDFTVFFKFHHSLADGYSIFNAMMNWTDADPRLNNNNVKNESQQRSIIFKCQQYGNLALFPIRAPYDFAKIIMEQYLGGSLWEEFKFQNKSELRVYLKSKSLKIINLKRKSIESKITFTTVVITTVTKGIKKFLQKSGRKIPDYILCPMPLPIPRTSIGLKNSFTVGSLKIPLMTDDPDEMLKMSNIFLKETKTSNYNTIVFLMLQFIGKLPLCFLQRKPQMMESLFISNFAGPKSLISLDGHNVLDMSFSINFSKGFPMILTLLTYNGALRLILNVDGNLFENESTLESLMYDIEEEFDSL